MEELKLRKARVAERETACMRAEVEGRAWGVTRSVVVKRGSGETVSGRGRVEGVVKGRREGSRRRVGRKEGICIVLSGWWVRNEGTVISRWVVDVVRSERDGKIFSPW